MICNFFGLAEARKGPASQDLSFLGYCRDEMSLHCPYISASLHEGLLFASPYSLDELRELSQTGDAAETLFFVLLGHVEVFRNQRRQLSRRSSCLLCDNVIVNTGSELTSETTKALLGWPHWLLKCLYSERNIMFGKFWRGESLVTVHDISILPPIHTFVSIRTAIMDRDLVFIEDQPEISARLTSGSDHIDPEFPNGIGLNELLKNAPTDRGRLYSQLLTWSQSLLPMGS